MSAGLLTAATLVALVALSLVRGIVEERRRRRAAFLEDVRRLSDGIRAMQAMIGLALIPSLREAMAAFAEFDRVMRETNDLLTQNGDSDAKEEA